MVWLQTVTLNGSLLDCAPFGISTSIFLLQWNYTKQEGVDSGSLIKITLAPQITPRNTVMSRPALRVFVTYAFWSDSFVGQISPLSYGNQKDGLTFGIQAETWW